MARDKASQMHSKELFISARTNSTSSVRVTRSEVQAHSLDDIMFRVVFHIYAEAYALKFGRWD